MNKDLSQPHVYDHVPSETTSTATSEQTHVSVPVAELKTLEKERLELYTYLSSVLDRRQMYKLTLYTGQIWRVANTKKW